jgi:hypothetical protein
MDPARNIDFIGIGAARSGTSWLANCLRCHPDIGISEPKEVRYFNSLDWPGPGANGLEARAVNANFSRPVSWYFKHFEHCMARKMIGEYSPIYLYDEAAPRRIQELFPDVRLIVSLRNPIERAYSHFGMIRGVSGADWTFDEAVKRFPFLIDMGLYAVQLKRYLERFNRDRILVLVFEDLVEKPVESLTKVFKFLGVVPEIESEMVRSDTNPLSGERAPIARKLLLRTSRALINLNMGPLIHGLRKAGAYRLFNRINRKPLEIKEMREETRRLLRDAFRSDINELQSMIERDLSEWV